MPSISASLVLPVPRLKDSASSVACRTVSEARRLLTLQTYHIPNLVLLLLRYYLLLPCLPLAPALSPVLCVTDRTKTSYLSHKASCYKPPFSYRLPHLFVAPDQNYPYDGSTRRSARRSGFPDPAIPKVIYPTKYHQRNLSIFKSGTPPCGDNGY